MNSDKDQSPNNIPGWDLFGEEVLRWNTQFSLISRTEPDAMLYSLLDESRDSFSALIDFMATEDLHAGGLFSGRFEIRYVDLGSGGGFPGLPWSLLLRDRFGPTDTDVEWSATLVEPRRKRAWFLERCSRLLDLESKIDVVESRWGDAEGEVILPPSGIPVFWLISLKALRLGESEVLRGLARHRGRAQLRPGDLLAVCRFHSGSDQDVDADISELGLPRRCEPSPKAPDSPHSLSLPFISRGRPRALLLSLYRGPFSLT